jgi:hypothetical protein
VTGLDGYGHAETAAVMTSGTGVALIPGMNLSPYHGGWFVSLPYRRWRGGRALSL